MDSITQGLLGALTFAAVKDKEIGKKSLLIGAIAGTIPDMDVFLSPLFSDVAFLTIHRSVSHSIILAVLLSLMLGSIFHRIYKKRQSQPKWIFAFFLAIMTHSLLDWCTTYGTKFLSPFSSQLFSTNNIHVFEPIYTFILLIGVVLLAARNQTPIGRRRIMNLSLLLSTMYLGWTFVSKGIANNRFVQELEKQDIDYQKLIVSPTPLNTVLWHGIAKTPKGFYFGTYSLLDNRNTIKFQFEESQNALIEEIQHNRLVKYYLEYTQGFPLIREDIDGNIEIFAVKYGPVNYFGSPRFIHPLSFNRDSLQDENIRIDQSKDIKGPIKNYRTLFQRIKGV
ncbi:MAG: inner membrane protein [Litorivivens sp.]|jgi:inner membrane protein